MTSFLMYFPVCMCVTDNIKQIKPEINIVKADNNKQKEINGKRIEYVFPFMLFRVMFFSLFSHINPSAKTFTHSQHKYCTLLGSDTLSHI